MLLITLAATGQNNLKNEECEILVKLVFWGSRPCLCRTPLYRPDVHNSKI